MIDLLLLLLFNALYIVGVFIATGNDMILERPARWIERYVREPYTKPMFNCPACMASLHSIIPYWYYHDLTVETVIVYIIYVPALATLSTLIANKAVTE